MPEGDTSLNMESAAKLVDSLLSAPAEKEKPATAPKPEKPAPAKATAEIPESSPAETEQPGEEPTETHDDETPDDEPAPEPRKVKVKADGQELEVTEDELVKGYSRQTDYTRKTQQLADERKAFEAARDADLAKVRAAGSEYEQRLTAVHQALSALTPAEPNWDDLRASIGSERTDQEYRLFHQQRDRLNKVAAERDRVKAENDKALSADADKFLETERGKLRDAVPEWKEPEKFAAGITELRTYAKDKMGFSDAELNTVSDSRLLLVLRKAMLHDAAVVAKPKVEQKIADSMVTAAPGSSVESKPTSELTKAKQRLAKSGRVDDAAAAIAHLL